MYAGYYEALAEAKASGRTIEPRPGTVYTTQQVLNELILADSPSLSVVWNGRTHPVQHSHLSAQDTESWLDNGAADRLWRYERTTHEWIPVFVYVDNRHPGDILDAERWKYQEYEPQHKQHDGALWMTPRGFPRKQF